MEPAAEFVTPPTPTFLISVSFTTETRGLRSVVSGRQALFLCGGGERIVTSMYFFVSTRGGPHDIYIQSRLDHRPHIPTLPSRIGCRWCRPSTFHEFPFSLREHLAACLRTFITVVLQSPILAVTFV